MADLRLDELQGVIDYGYLEPGDPDASDLIARIESDDPAYQMPPPDSNRRLNYGQIDTLRQWVLEGAPFESHWSFTPPADEEPPNIDSASSSNIDRFLDAARSEAGLERSPPAAPELWLRRASLDITGLPPTIAEIDSFLGEVVEQGDAAYAAAAKRLLASRHYGERMAIDWLDVARYADTHGFNNDSARSMWRYRDWVIDSFNRNQPYDEFITEQLAGDLLSNPTVDQLIATAFNRNHVINSEGGIIDEEYRVEYVADRVRTVSMAWLGLTFECARCHDHKYDPITTKDYYRLFAFFDNVPELGEDGRVANAPPMIQAPTARERAQIASIDKRIEQLRDQVERALPVEPIDQASVAELGARAVVSAESVPTDVAFELNPVQSVGDADPSLRDNSFPREEPHAFASDKLALAPRSAHTFTLWFRQTEDCPPDTPLISSMTYLSNPADQFHGRGVEVRLVDGEIEYRLSERLPAYSITVRSVGANIVPGEWRHVAVTYAGASDDSGQRRALASGVRICVDGQILPTITVHDCLSFLSKNLIAEPYLIGASGELSGDLFSGEVSSAKAYDRALPPDELREGYLALALPQALSAAESDAVSARGQRLLREVASELQGGQTAGLLAELRAAERERADLMASLPTVMVMQELATPRQTHLLLRGQ